MSLSNSLAFNNPACKFVPPLALPKLASSKFLLANSLRGLASLYGVSPRLFPEKPTKAICALFTLLSKVSANVLAPLTALSHLLPTSAQYLFPIQS